MHSTLFSCPETGDSGESGKSDETGGSTNSGEGRRPKKTVFFQENFLNSGRRGRVKFLILLVIHYPHLIKLILITHFLVSTNRC